MLTDFIVFDAITAVYIHIGVGFGVARFDKQAMPEPQNVGRVTRRFPRFFISYRKLLTEGLQVLGFCLGKRS